MSQIEKSHIEAAVLRVLSIVLKQPLNLLGSDTSRENTLNWDSLKHIEIMFAIEEELSVQFFEDELSKLYSVARIVEAVKAHYAS